MSAGKVCGLSALAYQKWKEREENRVSNLVSDGYRTVLPVAWFGKRGWTLDQEAEEGDHAMFPEHAANGTDYLKNVAGNPVNNPPLGILEDAFSLFHSVLSKIGLRKYSYLFPLIVRIFVTRVGVLAMGWIAVTLCTLVCLAFELTPARRLHQALTLSNTIPEAVLKFLHRYSVVNAAFKLLTTLFNLYRRLLPGNVVQDALKCTLLAPVVLAEHLNHTRALLSVAMALNLCGYVTGLIMDRFNAVKLFMRVVRAVRGFLSRFAITRGLVDFIPNDSALLARIVYTCTYAGVAAMIPMAAIYSLKRHRPIAAYWFTDGIDILTLSGLTTVTSALFVITVLLARYSMSLEDHDDEKEKDDKEKEKAPTSRTAAFDRFGGVGSSSVYYANATIAVFALYVVASYLLPSSSVRNANFTIQHARKWIDHDATTQFTKNLLRKPTPVVTS